jgi:hypothetical protein
VWATRCSLLVYKSHCLLVLEGNNKKPWRRKSGVPAPVVARAHIETCGGTSMLFHATRLDGA